MRIAVVKLGANLVPVRYKKLRGKCGEYSNDDRPTITIDSRLSPHQTALAIFHESIHAVFNLYFARRNNEQAVRAAEMGVAALLIDNPELMQALQKADK